MEPNTAGIEPTEPRTCLRASHPDALFAAQAIGSNTYGPEQPLGLNRDGRQRPAGRGNCLVGGNLR
eukprot:12787033-Alexandrium_andersonii.AAC.1